MRQYPGRWLQPYLNRSTIRGFLAIALTLGLAARAATESTFAEYDVKAVFIYNFVNFIQWPETAFGGAEAPFTICVLGENLFDGAIRRVVKSASIDGRRFVVHDVGALENTARCHILFICRSETDRLDGLLEGLNGRPVLTVSDIPGFASRGGSIGLVGERTQIRLEINPGVIGLAGLHASSKLLRLATVVETPVAVAER